MAATVHSRYALECGPPLRQGVRSAVAATVYLERALGCRLSLGVASSLDFRSEMWLQLGTAVFERSFEGGGALLPKPYLVQFW